MSSTATAFVHATLKRSQKVARFCYLGWIPMIQVRFHSSCVALQYKTKTKVIFDFGRSWWVKVTFNPFGTGILMSESTIDESMMPCIYPACTNLLHGTQQLLYIYVS